MSSTRKITRIPYLLVRSCTHPMAWLLELSLARTFAGFEQTFQLERRVEELKKKLETELHSHVPQCSSAEERKETLEIKRGVQRGILKSGFPTREWHEQVPPSLAQGLSDWSELRLRQKNLEEELRGTFEEESELSWKRFRALLDQPLLQEGVLLSSQHLFEALQRFRGQTSNPARQKSKSDRQFSKSLLFHLSRACGKTTPRGLLAGVGLVPLAPGEQPPPQGPQSGPLAGRRTILTKTLANAIAREIGQNKTFSEHAVPRSNPTWYRKDGKIYFWAKEEEQNFLRALPDEQPFRAFLEIASQQIHTPTSLVDAVSLACGGNFERQTLFDLFYKLCQKQILIHQLEVPFEDIDGLAYLLNWFRGLPESIQSQSDAIETRTRLEFLRNLLDRIDSEPLSIAERIGLYENLKERVRATWPAALASLPSPDLSEMLVVESRIPVRVQPNPALHKAVEEATETLIQMTEHYGASLDSSRIVSGFLERHGVPRGQRVLASELVGARPENRAVTPMSSSATTPPPTEADSIAKLVTAAAEAHLHEVDLGTLPSGTIARNHPLKNNRVLGQDIVFRLVGRDNSEFDILVEAVVNHCGIHFLRHADFLQDEGMLDSMRKATQLSQSLQDPDAVWADCPLATQTRVDTAIWFPTLSPKFVQMQTRSGRPVEEAIGLRDIEIRNSEDGHASMTLANTEKRLPFRAHMPSLINLALCDPMETLFNTAGLPTGPSLVFWRGKLPRLAHRPRIRLGKVIFERESWTFDGITRFPDSQDHAWEVFKSWNAWRDAQRMPRHVFFRRDTEKPSWIDFANLHLVEILDSETRKHPESRFHFVEMLPTPEAEVNLNSNATAAQYVTALLWEP